MMKNVIDILRDNGCFDFLNAGAERALEKLQSARPDGFALLTDEARADLRKNCVKRLEAVYAQTLAQDLKDEAARRDPIGTMLGKENTELEAQIAAEMAQKPLGGLLRERLPLAAEYEARLLDNFLLSWTEFFDALTACRGEIEARLLDGKAFTEIERFSDYGGDPHRHGRAVTGVYTDAGVFYYKPHECGVDAMYRKLVERWFSDCTAAARVVRGDGVAFVSCLRAAPVETEAGISDYYFHFGVLTALLHGLGSIDMHLENIMACGDRPAVIDLETLISPSYTEQAKNRQLEPTAHLLGQSVYRIGILPVRMYGKPLFSPLYSKREGSACLPVYEGKTYTVEGYEARYLAGFRDGYGRMLAHREEIRALLRECRGATVRCLMRNTVFYALIRRSLYRPAALQSEEEREKVLRRLALPFEQTGAEVFREQVEHEAACLRRGDIPYFCTPADGTELCGDDPRQTVKEGYFSDSPLGMTAKSLDRLSGAELRYEEDIIRLAFAHAPLDAPKELAPQPVEGPAADAESARGMAAELFRALRADVIRQPDGSQIWVSTAVGLRGFRSFGNTGALAEAGAFCAGLLRTEALAEIHGEAMETARACAQGIRRSVAGMLEAGRAAWESGACIAVGLYNGCGGVLWGLAAMERAGVPLAGEASDQLLRLLSECRDFWLSDSTAAEGTAGLMLALDRMPGGSAAYDDCVRLCAERLLAAGSPELPDAPKGATGIAAALASVCARLGDGRCAEKASALLRRVRDDYSEALRGWPDSGVKLRWMAGRGTQAAGIALAADHAAKRLPEPGGAEELRELALSSLMDETELGRYDTLDQGNALAALCLMRLGHVERAGQVLEAMRRRAERVGSFIVSAPGIRSAFDPALWLGSLGVGCAAAEYLRIVRKEEDQ